MRSRAPAWATGERGRFSERPPSAPCSRCCCSPGSARAVASTCSSGSAAATSTTPRPTRGSHGTWQVSGDILGIERFESHGGTYMYQGPWPALLRVPVVAVTSTLRRTAHAWCRCWRGGRRRPRPPPACTGACAGSCGAMRPLARADLVVAGLATFVVGGGSAMLYEASRPWVYHEAAVWGAAWSIAAIDAAVGCVTQPSRRRFVWAALATTLALTSRARVGLAGVAALAILCGGNLLVRIRAAQADRPTAGLARWLRPFRSLSGCADSLRSRFPVLAPGLAAVVPVAVYAAINWIKFRTLFSIPFWGQGFTIDEPDAPGVPRGERRDAVRPEVRADHGRAVPAPGRALPHPHVPVRRLPGQGHRRSAASSST